MAPRDAGGSPTCDAPQLPTQRAGQLAAELEPGASRAFGALPPPPHPPDSFEGPALPGTGQARPAQGRAGQGQGSGKKPGPAAPPGGDRLGDTRTQFRELEAALNDTGWPVGGVCPLEQGCSCIALNTPCGPRAAKTGPETARGPRQTGVLSSECWGQREAEKGCRPRARRVGVGREGRGGQVHIPERAHLLPGEQEALLGRARLGLEHLQLHLQLRGNTGVRADCRHIHFLGAGWGRWGAGIPAPWGHGRGDTSPGAIAGPCANTCSLLVLVSRKASARQSRGGGEGKYENRRTRGAAAGETPDLPRR